MASRGVGPGRGSLWLLSLVVVCSARATAAGKILALVEDLSVQYTHSIFFKNIASRGHDVEFRLVDDDEVHIEEYGEWLYDGLVLFTPTAEELAGGIGVETLEEFIDSGKDLLIAAGPGSKGAIRSLVKTVGIELFPYGSFAIDHVEKDEAGGGHDQTRIVLDSASTLIKAELVVGEARKPILYKGTTLSVGEDNDLAFKALVGATTTYAGYVDSAAEAPEVAGAGTTLIAAMQARNNARVVVAGSVKMFSDEYFGAEVATAADSARRGTGNEALCDSLAKWVFKDSGLLQASDIRHFLAGTETTPDVYTIKQDLDLFVDIMELKSGTWVPYEADDVKVEFVMLDPYIRTALSHDGKGLYSTTFKVPDVWGVFQFKITYNKLGYSSIVITKEMPVRPLKHYEYERFIYAASPYYMASFSMLAGFVAFGFLFLYHK